MDRLDGYRLDGREMRVQMARYGRPSPPYVPKYSGGRYSRRFGVCIIITCIYCSSLGLVEVEVGLHEGGRDILDPVLEKEGDAAGAIHHIVGKAILGHILERESLGAHHPVLEVVHIPDRPGQVPTHLRPNTDQKRETRQVIQQKSHGHLLKSIHAPNLP